MSKRANMTMVGLFVLVAIGLGIAATVVLASGSLFRDNFTVFSLFDGSVQGLQVGAPVVFRGVEIGQVREIRLMLPDDPRRQDPAGGDARIPVLYDIDNTLLAARGGTGQVDRQTATVLVEQGLTAQLVTESFVTGRLLISLDFRPTAVTVLDDWPVPWPQIPTVPTPIQEIQQQVAGLIDKLEDIDVSSVVDALEGALLGIRDRAQDPDLDRAIESLHSTLVELDRTMGSFRTVAEDLSADVHKVAEAADARADQLESVLDETESTLVAVQRLVSMDSPLSVQLAYTLEQLGDAARALRILSEAIEQNPSVLIRGRAVPEGNR